jgi:hypothetical protein
MSKSGVQYKNKNGNNWQDRSHKRMCNVPGKEVKAQKLRRAAQK